MQTVSASFGRVASLRARVPESGGVRMRPVVVMGFMG